MQPADSDIRLCFTTSPSCNIISFVGKGCVASIPSSAEFMGQYIFEDFGWTRCCACSGCVDRSLSRNPQTDQYGVFLFLFVMYSFASQFFYRRPAYLHFTCLLFQCSEKPYCLIATYCVLHERPLPHLHTVKAKSVVELLSLSRNAYQELRRKLEVRCNIVVAVVN